ncbi:glycosyltransferase [Neomoorella mulderi]|uniref:N-acetylglucosaminyl-diphospho-decaprenol L-rhamnosyltransferase n=1 Tax=Moorella mulderi DSM 14980 TaxID=1122241 RepID=A0A151AYF5_9FIRM|nr:glycosyltransferase [Moorella mulderi]KYH32685.1 N-acetylglucosaminyl-diphospho-decaprenol L-rhamnosyltransferase [Moorella mulderi DSM 14980]
MDSRWTIKHSEKLNAYQVYSEKLKGGAFLSVFNAFSIGDKVILNLLFEDDNYVYPVLFAELNPFEGRLTVPSNALALITEDVADTLRIQLLHNERKLGQHSTLFFTKENSFLARLLQGIRNPQRTPYLGLTDIRTQKKSYLLYKQIAESLKTKALNILDLGCGSGYGSALLARAGFKVTAIDMDNLPITYAKRLYTGNTITFACQPLEELLQVGKKFDAVVACEVLEHNDDYESFLKKMVTVTRAGGQIAISVPSWFYHGIDLNSDHRTNWTFSRANKDLKRFFRIHSKYVIKCVEDPQKYSICPVYSELQGGENFLFIGENGPAPTGFNSRPSSVLLVCHNIPPYEYTGTPLVTRRYARELQRLGYRVAVLVPNLPVADSKGRVVLEESDGVPIYRVPPVDFIRTSLEALSSTDRLKLQPFEQIFNHFCPDIVHIIDYVFMPPQILQLAADYGTAVIRHICNTEEICLQGSPVISRTRKICAGPDNPRACARCILSPTIADNDIFTARQVSQLAGQISGWQEYMHYLYSKIVDAAIFTSVSFGDYFLKYLPVPEKKIYHVPHGFLPSAFPKRRPRDKERVTFGFLGEIAFRKGIDLLIKAFQGLPENKVELLVYGKIRDRVLFNELKDVPCARYMGEYTPEDVDSILQNIDVGIVPSHFETYSMVLREFLSYGIPVIATRFFGSEIIQDGENGLLVEIGNAEELRQKVLAIINYKDLLVKLQAGAYATKIPSIYEEIDTIHHIYQETYERKFGVRGGVTGASRNNVEQLASIIIPVFNNWEYTRRCLLSLEAAGYRDKAEVIVVDNASSDETPAEIKTQFPWVKSIRHEQNLGFAKACNRGAEAARGKYLVFLNNDTEVKKGWLEALINALEKETSAGIVGSKLLYPDGRLQHAGVEITYPGSSFPIYARHLRYGQPDVPDTRQEVDAVTGASMLIRRDVFYGLCGFEEAYQNGYEDVDLCLKARARGYRIIYEPTSQAVHYESKTSGRFNNELKNFNLFHRRWLPYVLQHYRKTSLPKESRPTERPPVSIIIVTYNSLAAIASCLESVLATTSGRDEIIVVDNNSRDETPYYVECLQKILPEGRIRFHCETVNTGYAGAAARGAVIASRDYLVFLNPDTVVYPGWLEGLLGPLTGDDSLIAASGPVSNYAAGLQNVVHYIGREDLQQRTAADLAQALAEQQRGKIVPTNLLIGFCLAVKRRIYEEVGGIDTSLFLGNDDLDFSWRLARAGYRQIVVPSVFVYHLGQKSFRTEPAPRTAYLVQQSANQLYEKLYASYAGSPPDGKSLWNIEWFTPQREKLSIIMPVYKASAITAKALAAIGKWTARPFEIIVVDNGNDPALRGLIKELPEDLRRRILLLTNEENVGYPNACNQGLAAASGEYLVVMNNDVLVTPYWASRLMAAFSVDKTIGIVGPYTNFAAGIQGVQGCNYSEDSLETWAHKWHQKNAGNLKLINRLIGFLWMIKRKVVDDVGGLDPLYGIGNFEDDDYCLRAQLAGYKLVLAEDVFVHHYGSQSFRQHSRAYADILQTNAMLFAVKWGIQMHGNSYSPVDVVSRGPKGFDPGDLYIPLRFSDIFSPQVAPLDVGAGGRTGILCIPDPSDRECRWLEVVRQYAHNYHPDAEFALIIRVEPSRVEWLNQVVSAIQQMALKEKIDLEREDIVIEARQIPSSQRGSVYRAARYFIPLPGVRREALLREARACGLEVIDPEQVGNVVLSYR